MKIKFRVGGTWKKIITITIAIQEKAKLTRANTAFSTGKTALSILTFLRRGAAEMIEVMPCEVESFMKAKVTFPIIK